MTKELTARQTKEREEEPLENPKEAVPLVIPEGETEIKVETPWISEETGKELEKPFTDVVHSIVDVSAKDETVAILQEKIKALEEAVLRGNKPYTKSAEGATVCPECGSFTDHKENPLTYGCLNCGASFHPAKPSI